MFKVLLGLLLMNSAWGSKVRHVEMTKDEIVTVRTSIGIATIIQVPDRPNSVVVGDQDSFKVEYLDQAITIKPLNSFAKSNLYVYTDYRRFNIELVTGPPNIADYVVYLKQPKSKKPDPVKWMRFNKSLSNDGVVLIVKRLGFVHGEILLVEFDITSNQKVSFRPDWVWLTQNGETKPIHNLVLSSLEIPASKKISGLLQIRKFDLSDNESFRLELRRSKTSFLTLPKVNSWKL